MLGYSCSFDPKNVNKFNKKHVTMTQLIDSYIKENTYLITFLTNSGYNSNFNKNSRTVETDRLS